jgi:hypothetical protein
VFETESRDKAQTKCESISAHDFKVLNYRGEIYEPFVFLTKSYSGVKAKNFLKRKRPERKEKNSDKNTRTHR